MKNIILLFASFLLLQSSFSQKRYFTKTGTVSFTAGTALEDISAINKSTTSVFADSSGQIEFALLVKGFEFKNALMQEHFNENYMESDKYPKSTFKGRVTDFDKINFDKNGSYPVTVKGILEIHGVKKEIETTGTFKVDGETVSATAAFTVALEDYKIGIPGVVEDKISKTANIKVSCNYAVLK